LLFYNKENSLKNKQKIAEVKSRLKLFIPDIEFNTVSNISLINALNNSIIIYTGEKPPSLYTKLKTGLLFNLDYDLNDMDGWEYHRILTLLEQKTILANRPLARSKLASIKNQLKAKYNKAYIFGTGPSLEKAIDRSWGDGIRIVSNTIVKDKELWNHINPHFIVAGDAIYHYGFSRFAKNFRDDLAQRLAETDTYFVFQEQFFPFIKRQLPQFEDRFIPIPIVNSQTFYNIIQDKFELPALGNVLNGLLLPLSQYLSDNINLWGFDGRSPDAKLFWKNSEKHFYSEHVAELQQLHPAFFNKLVPKDDPGQYVKTVHGDALNNMLLFAEQRGITFNMLHPSYTKTLMDRHRLL
jgi:hypothetical protein